MDGASLPAARLAPGAGSFDSRLAAAAAELWRDAGRWDEDGADPASLCAPLGRHGLFVDALPRAAGGSGLAQDAGPRLCRTLMAIGGADLSAGRIFEGHVNAVKLVLRYGTAAQAERLAADVAAGAVCGVWNAEAPPGLRIDRAPSPDASETLQGGKIYASGLGFVTRPLVTARTPQGDLLMLAPEVPPASTHDLASWRVRGMRATATGSVDFTGMSVGVEEMIGAPGDYYRAPLFRGGAWRFAAVQAGATSRLVMLATQALKARGRDGDPHQRARLGAVALASQTAELWVERAAVRVEDPSTDPAEAEAFANLTRIAVEQASLEAIGLAERAAGLIAFTRPDPIDRVARDLSTYLRQPFPDAALDGAAGYVLDRDGAPGWSLSSVFPR